MPDVIGVIIQNPEQQIKAVHIPDTSVVQSAVISRIGPDGLSGYSGYSGHSGRSGYSGYSGFSGFSGFSGDPAQQSGYSGYSGNSGYSGFCGLSGYSGFCGTSGYSGYSGNSGYSGFSGPQGSAGTAGTSGYSGFCGLSGYSGFCGVSGYSGYSGSGVSGYSGYSGSGVSGYSGYSGAGLSGYSGFCGLSGYSGFSATSPGESGYSGYSGKSGYSGYSGQDGTIGQDGLSGYSGYSGYSGKSGYSGFCGLSGYSGYSGFSGLSGYSGFCGLSGYSGFSSPGFLSNETARVDASGDDLTGIVGDLTKPFLTAQGAIDAIEAGSFSFPTIDIGTYRDTTGTVTTSLSRLNIVGASRFDSYLCGHLILTSTTATTIMARTCRLGALSLTADGGGLGLSVYLFDAYCPDLSLTGTGLLVINGTAAGTTNDIISSITTTTAGGVLVTNAVVDGIDCAGINVRLSRCLIDGDVTACGTLTLEDSRFLFAYTNNANSTVYDDHWLKGIGPGGTTGQIQAKASNDDFDVEWINPPASGYSGYSGFSGRSGYSGYCGLSGYSGFSGTIGFAGTQPFWFQDSSSDIGSYLDIKTVPESGTETSQSAVCNNNTVLIQSFASTSEGLGVILIPSGEWTFDFFANVDSVLLSSFLVVEVYSRTSGGSETLLFTTTSPELNSTSITEYTWSEIHEEFATNVTDRLVFKVYGQTTRITDTTVRFYYLGQTHYSRIVTALTPVGISGYSGYSGKSGYSGFCGLSGYSGYCGLSGYSGYSGYSAISGYSGFSGYSGANLVKVNVVEPIPLQEVVGTIVTKSGTVTGTDGVGSSLFLKRVMIPSVMNLSEIDVAMSIGFPATNQGAGTMSRSMVLYSFGNATSLASVLSFSGTSAWATGTSTAGGNTSLTQYQGGWSVPLVQPMTFASTAVSAGEYVIGQLFDFAQASSTWTLAFYGAKGASSFLASAATNLTSASLGAVSVATVAGSGVTGVSSYASNFLALSTAGSFTAFVMSQTVSTGASSFSGTQSTGISAHAWSFTNTAKSVSFQLGGNSANSNIVSSVGVVAGSIINGLTTLGAVTNVALGALNSSTLAQLTLPNFGFIGTGSTTSNFPTNFMNGIMSTGAVPAAITLTAAGVTWSGSYAHQQPWFLMAGA